MVGSSTHYGPQSAGHVEGNVNYNINNYYVPAQQPQHIPAGMLFYVALVSSALSVIWYKGVFFLLQAEQLL